MKRAIYFFVIILISCKQNPEVFSLTGTTNGIDDGATLYLDNTATNKTIDSATVKGNTFKFSTSVEKSPLQVVLRTKDFSQYRFLWIENRAMIFDGANTDFKHALVSGSETEYLNQQFRRSTDTVARENRQKLEMKFVSENPNSIISAHMLSVYSTTWGKEKTKKLFDAFSMENKNSDYGKKISKYIELNREPGIGERYVDFEMTDINGEIKRLSDLAGKTVLLEFWASWCGPCRQENPNLVRTYDKFNREGFEVFAVSLDQDEKSWHKAITDDELPWVHVSELNGSENSASLIYGINGIPDNFLINQNGIIVGRNLRGSTLDEKLTTVMAATSKR